MLSAGAQGAAAGVAATLAMSGVMAAGAKTGLMGETPPKLLTRSLLPGGGSRTPRPGEDTATAVTHLGIGAAAGAVFGVLTGGRRPRARTGVAYGLGVWLLGYEGWIPALTVQPPAHRDAPGRVGTMVLAHVVYGSALAAGLRRMRGSG